METLQHPNMKTVQIEVDKQQAKKWIEAGWVPAAKQASVTTNRKAKTND